MEHGARARAAADMQKVLESIGIRASAPTLAFRLATLGTESLQGLLAVPEATLVSLGFLEGHLICLNQQRCLNEEPRDSDDGRSARRSSMRRARY